MVQRVRTSGGYWLRTLHIGECVGRVSRLDIDAGLKRGHPLHNWAFPLEL
jgi:hypothetical protein